MANVYIYVDDSTNKIIMVNRNQMDSEDISDKNLIEVIVDESHVAIRNRDDYEWDGNELVQRTKNCWTDAKDLRLLMECMVEEFAQHVLPSESSLKNDIHDRYVAGGGEL